VFAFALMMAGYLVIRFVVMTAPVWATVAIVPQAQGILRSAASVAAAAIVHPVIMAVGASISVLTTGYLLDPDTGLGWLGLGLSVLFTAMMQVVLRPYGRLRGLLTGEPVETPTQALNRLRAQATGLAQAAGPAQATGLHQTDPTNTTAADATTITPDPAPATGTVALRFTRPDHTPAWAREDHGGGPEWTPITSPTRPGNNDLTIPAWARDLDDTEHVWLPPDPHEPTTPISFTTGPHPAPSLTPLEQGAAKVPRDWGSGVANSKGAGTRWFDPTNRGSGVRIDQGVPDSPWPSQQVDHVIVRSSGPVLGRDGQPIVGSIKQNPDAHIPLSEWINWSSWNKP
jgi:hypothetical protein